MENEAIALEFDFIEYRRVDDDVAILLINDPPANTLTYDLVFQLEELLLKLSLDSKLKALIVTGKGDKFFSGGVNIGMLRNASTHFNSDFILYAAEVFDRVVDSRFLVVTAINGHITGGGLELALIADYRVAIEGEYNFGFPEVKLGVIPGLGGTQRLKNIVGAHLALELITQGDFIGITKAHEIGAVDKILPKDDFIKNTVTYTKELLLSHKFEDSISSITNEWMAPAERLVEYRIENNTGIITINNCVDSSPLQVLWSLNQAVLIARQDQDCCAILITYNGKFFKLGNDSELDPFTWDYAEFVFKRLETYPRICVLAINNELGELETELALACDYRISKCNEITINPSKSGSEVRRNRYKSLQGKSYKEGSLISKCKEEYGLFKHIDSDNWMSGIEKWMLRYVPPRGASLAIGYAKLAIVKGSNMSLESGLLLERHLQEQLFRGHDSDEGMRAYMEKRSTKFKGE